MAAEGNQLSAVVWLHLLLTFHNYSLCEMLTRPAGDQAGDQDAGDECQGRAAARRRGPARALHLCRLPQEPHPGELACLQRQWGGKFVWEVRGEGCRHPWIRPALACCPSEGPL
jgi:hypothetical protein